MEELSNLLLMLTVVAYTGTMIAYAAQYAFGDRGVVARVAMRQPAMSGAAGPDPGQASDPSPAGGTADGDATGRIGRLGRVALGLLVTAALLHLAATVTRGIAAERLPWGNMYEFVLTATLIGVAVWLAVLVTLRSLHHLSLYVALVNVVMLGLGWVVFYSPVDPLVPALNSAWFIIHVAAATVASGIFLVGFVTAVMYLIRAGYDGGKRSFLYPVGRALPGAEAIERLTFRLHAFAFPIWTFAVIGGAIWAEAAWGRYWAWDPKEVWAFISWVVYAAYLHARATPSSKPRVAAWLAVLGFLALLMNLVGVNLFFESLHSYA